MTLWWFPEFIFLKVPADIKWLRLNNEVRLVWVGADLIKSQKLFMSVQLRKFRVLTGQKLLPLDLWALGFSNKPERVPEVYLQYFHVRRRTWGQFLHQLRYQTLQTIKRALLSSSWSHIEGPAWRCEESRSVGTSRKSAVMNNRDLSRSTYERFFLTPAELQHEVGVSMNETGFTHWGLASSRLCFPMLYSWRCPRCSSSSVDNKSFWIIKTAKNEGEEPGSFWLSWSIVNSERLFSIWHLQLMFPHLTQQKQEWSGAW